MIDNHVHIGWYTNGYNAPEYVWKDEIRAGIKSIVVSSTSTCAELYKLVVREFTSLNTITGNKSSILPILWLTPKMLTTWGIRHMLKSKIKWKGIKMHWMAHKQWYYDKKIQNKALSIARELNVPILLHTGYDKECQAIVFKNICEQNPDLIFILAHGKPILDTIEILRLFPNVWTDTAFMPIEDIQLLKEEGLTDRTMFGSDAPINRIYYPDLSTEEYLKARIEEVKGVAPEILSNCVYNK